MYYVYLLQSRKDFKIYTGYTVDLKRRIREHFRGQVHTTYRMGVVELVYYEAFKSKIDAVERENYLKTTKGKRTVRLMLENSLKKAPIV